jgi:hypothetical protein
VGRAAAVLSPARSAALAALGAGVVAYYFSAGHVPRPPCGARPDCMTRVWIDVAIVALTLMPAMFGLVYGALPLRRGGNALIIAAIALAVLTVGLTLLHFEVVANLAKFVAVVLAGWWFLTFFEDVSWVVLVALIVPVVDTYSVWRGPTHTIVHHHADVFNAASVAFTVPGGGAFHLGLPDVLFFALFLAAAARWRLRLPWTWLALTGSFVLTLVLAISTNAYGLPALPLLAAGFLLPNADLLWTRLRARTRTK